MPVAKFNLDCAHLDGKHVHIEQSHTDDLDPHPSPRSRENCLDDSAALSLRLDDPAALSLCLDDPAALSLIIKHMI